MFKSKGATFGVAVAVVASALLVAGLAFDTTRGAATDFGGAPSGGFGNPTTGNPPAAEEEPGTNPGTVPTNPVPFVPGQPTTGIDPTGGAGAGSGAPGSLPSAGFGFADGGAGSGAMVVLLALAGAALIGVGATVVSSSRRS
jgi:hypothetical protein